MAGLAGNVPILYALALGMVAAVNPCGLPMLPAYLALFSGTQGSRLAPRLARSLLAGAGVSVGFVAVFGVLGLVLEGALQLVLGFLPWIMSAVGVAMATAGVMTLAGHGPSLRLPVPRMRGAGTFAAMTVYGVAYGIGSLSCALPLFLAAVSGSFTGQGFVSGLASFLAYALGMGLFVTAAAVVTTTAGSAALRRVRFVSRWLPVLSGLVLVVAGIYVAAMWVSDLLGVTWAATLSAPADRLQAGLTGVLDSRPIVTAVVLGAVVLASFAIVVRRSLQSGPVLVHALNTHDPHVPSKGAAAHD
ncbi:cytochrome c biogenesis CcdA family protein [Arthrobacter sp.]|uniref:cytochrome c biogenesis CcdA family protein n=1 Tax=Arthrobacter sp. TaxID=1667 RepID=UPI003A92199A